jgi:hypothetical protein
MKIASSQIQLSAAHSSFTSSESSETLRAWVGSQRPNFEAGPTNSSPTEQDRISISEAARQAQQSAVATTEAGSAQAIKDASDQADHDPKLKLLKTIIEMMLGRKIHLLDVSSLMPGSSQGQTATTAPAPAENTSTPSSTPPSSAGYGVEYDYHQTYSESEQTQFTAEGSINTSDGKSIQFSLSLEMSRSYVEQTDISLRLGDARKAKDPLILNFDGTAAQLSDQKFSFDLNSDGNSEEINFLVGNKGFLALDKNGNDKIDNGSELFGPTSGNGYQDLAAYDADHNGWIDENDPVFQRLKIWSKDTAGNDALASLQEKNVGALYLSKVNTPFALKDENNNLQASIKETGLFLQEDGKAGTMQRVDLVT